MCLGSRLEVVRLVWAVLVLVLVRYVEGPAFEVVSVEVMFAHLRRLSVHVRGWEVVQEDCWVKELHVQRLQRPPLLVFVRPLCRRCVS